MPDRRRPAQRKATRDTDRETPTVPDFTADGGSDQTVMASAEPAASSVVEGEITPTVRAVRVLIAVAVAGAVLAGVIRASTAGIGVAALIDGLVLAQVVLGAILILLGSLVEGFGFGLSLGTHWPYTRNIIVLLARGDPEAAHRIVATLVGLIGVALVLLAPQSATISGLALVVATAVFGIGTLHVLAGRLPAIVHGIHGLLAYGVFLSYLVIPIGRGGDFWSFFAHTGPLRAVVIVVLLGGMTTGQRGFGKPIGEFSLPRRAPQWVFVIHLVAALGLVGMLGRDAAVYPVAFYLVLGQVLIGFLLFHAVNLKPKAPGITVAFHQAMALAITIAIVA